MAEHEPTAVCLSCGSEVMGSPGARCPRCGLGTLAALKRQPKKWIGTTLSGKYQIIETIGRGSSATVYKARHLMLDSLVAVKMLETIGTPPEQVQRFRQEARTASKFRHPNNVMVIDSGQTDEGVLYLVMELIEGQPLSELPLPLPPSRALRLMRQVCGALAEAHGAE
jgi:serine/threonine-protein kinase